MALDLTYGAVRGLIAQEKLGWEPAPSIPDYVRLPHYAIGLDDAELVPTQDVPNFDFKALQLPTNPQIAIRRAERGIIEARDLERSFPTHLLQMLRSRTLPEAVLRSRDGADGPDVGSSRVATAVDWRNRWGANWITTVRDQNPCSACWAFAGTALIEAMLRIETGFWARLSEGDVHRGVGKTCPNFGNSTEVSRFFARNGLCDPGSWPFMTTSPPYVPTPDRNGRSVRGPEFVSVSVKDTKAWVDTVGPLYLSFDVYTDFSSYRSGVYRPASGPSNPLRGGHAVLLVGYDDALGAWLCKNSWGTNWGMNGFFWIAYGTSSVDTWSRMGLQGINPDPWTKRRLHNGNLYESGNGKTHRNLEVVALSGQQVQHRWRLGEAPWTWGKARAFGNDAASIPTLTGTTFNRNIEVVYATIGGRLHHWWTGGGGGAAWNDGGVFGPTGCKGMVGFTQGDYGAPGNFEVVAAIDGKLQHIWRSGGGWANGATFGARIGNAGASLLQSSYGGAHGNLEVVAARDDGTIQHFWRTSSDFVWHSGAVFGAGVSGPPIMVQGMYGMRDEAGPHGNFELCVCVGGQVQHWWRWNGGGDGQWRRSAVFGRDVRAVTGLCQSSWGGNLELVVTRTDGRSQHYFRNGSGWQDGGVFDGP